MDKQINHDKFHDESNTRTHRLSKLSDDGDPWAPTGSKFKRIIYSIFNTNIMTNTK